MLLSKTFKTAMFFAIGAIGFYACNNSACKTSNYIIEQAPFNSTIYNIELARSINASDSAQVKFVFNSLEEVEGKTYLLMQVQTSEGCIKGRFLATEESGINEQIANKKLGKGTELQGGSLQAH